jgi:hypothetical protein
MFSGDELSKRVDAEILKAREAERAQARRRGDLNPVDSIS